MSEAFNLSGNIKIDGNSVIAELGKIDNKLKGVDGSLNNTGKQAQKTGSLLSKMGEMGTKAMGKIDQVVKKGAIAVGGLASGVVAMGIKANASLETSITSWTTLLGTQENAKKMMDDITKYASSTPFSKAGVDAMAKQLHNAGYEGQNLFDQLTKFGNMGSAFGVQEDSLKEMVRQYSQVQMAQVAYTEDLNILQDRGIPIYKGLAEATGKSVAEVKKMASEGKISADIYNQAIDSIAKNTEGAMDKQSKTFSGMMSTLKDNLTNISQKILTPLFDKIIEVMPKFVELADSIGTKIDEGQGSLEAIKNSIIEVFGEENWNKIESMRNVVIGLAIAYGVLKGVMAISNLITAVSGAMEVLRNSTILQTVSQWALNSAFLANPITWIIGLIVLLVGAFIYLWNNSEDFRNFWIDCWEGIKDAVGSAVDWISGAWEKVKEVLWSPVEWAKEKIKGAIDAIKGFFDFDWSLPRIKLPHFSIDGEFSLSPPSIPHIGVDWYSTGGIFTQPTVLGGIGVGDANNGSGNQTEAVMRYQDLMSIVDKALNRPIQVSIDGRECIVALAPYQNILDQYTTQRSPRLGY